MSRYRKTFQFFDTEEQVSNTECAKVFIEAIKTIAEKPDNLDNLEGYLECHFDVWMEKFANTPEGLAYEIKSFAEMEIG